MPELLASLRGALPYGREITGLHQIPLSPSTDRLILQVGKTRYETVIWKRSTARELRLYREVLTPELAGSPALLGFVVHPEGAWLFLEALPERFPAFADPEAVEQVYQHLATLHQRFAGQTLRTLPGRSPWHVSAAEVAATLAAFPETTLLGPEAANLLCDGPFTLVQGDYHRWNLTLAGNRVRVLDWEHAAWAHPIWDLVMLGPDEEGPDTVPRGALAEHALRIYHRASGLLSLPWERFLRLQRMARLFVAARWALKHGAALKEALPPPVAETVQGYEANERRRIAHLTSLLRGGRGQ